MPIFVLRNTSRPKTTAVLVERPMKGIAAVPPTGKAMSENSLTRADFEGKSSMYLYCDPIVAMKKFILTICSIVSKGIRMNDGVRTCFEAGTP